MNKIDKTWFKHNKKYTILLFYFIFNFTTHLNGEEKYIKLWKVTSDTRNAAKISIKKNILFISTTQYDKKQNLYFRWQIESKLIKQKWNNIGFIIIDFNKDKLKVQKIKTKVNNYTQEKYDSLNNKIKTNFSLIINNNDIINRDYLNTITDLDSQLEINFYNDKNIKKTKYTLFQAIASVNFLLSKKWSNGKIENCSEIVLNNIITYTFARQSEILIVGSSTSSKR
jgi:hypothetical protein